MAATTTDTADLAQRARDAYATAQLTTNYQAMQRRMDHVGEIRRALAKHDITASIEQAFINPASGQICVPLVAGTVHVESDEDGFEYVMQTHAVGAEWDSDDRSVYLVADGDYDDPGFVESGRMLYPAGYLHTLADLGEAIERGGRKPATPAPSAANQVQRVLQRGLTSEYLDEHDNAILTAAEAVCAALADIADAIRAGHRP
jgi:hypothetical protein